MYRSIFIFFFVNESVATLVKLKTIEVRNDFTDISCDLKINLVSLLQQKLCSAGFSLHEMQRLRKKKRITLPKHHDTPSMQGISLRVIRLLQHGMESGLFLNFSICFDFLPFDLNIN